MPMIEYPLASLALGSQRKSAVDEAEAEHPDDKSEHRERPTMTGRKTAPKPAYDESDAVHGIDTSIGGAVAGALSTLDIKRGRK